MPYGSVTVGNPSLNLNFSGGYLTIGNGVNTVSAPLYSVGGLARLSDRVSFVGDSFIYYVEQDVLAVVIPGLRFDKKTGGGAFQFGLAGLMINDKVIPFPVPFLSWFIEI